MTSREQQQKTPAPDGGADMPCARLKLPRRRLLTGVIMFIIVATYANALFCLLRFESGFGPDTFLFGPGDRFADAVKVPLSYKTVLVPHLDATSVAQWPAIFRYYLVYNPYRGVDRLNSGEITHFHLPPLSQLLTLFAGLVSTTRAGPSLTLALFFLVYVLAVALVALRVLPRDERRLPVLACFGFLCLLSYPALLMLTRGNFHSGFCSLCIIIFLMALRGHRFGWLPLSMLALAVNLRPNAAVLAVAMPLVLGARAAVKPVVRFAALSILLGGVAFFTAHWIYPAYDLWTFWRGLEIYQKLYVLGPGGDRFNSSLLAFLKVFFRAPAFLLHIAPTTRTLSATFSALSAGLGLLILLRFRRPLTASTAAFLLACVCALCTPTFADYHLLVFVAPLLLKYLEGAGGEIELTRCELAWVAASAWVLSPKNYPDVGGTALQSVLNVVVMACAVGYVLAKDRGRLPAAVDGGQTPPTRSAHAT